MAEAGFADIAGAVLDEVNPTGRCKRLLHSHDELADGASAITRAD